MVNYDIAEHWEDLSLGKKARVMNLASDEQLRKWASDPYCNQKSLCAAALAREDILSLLTTSQGPRPKDEHVDVPFNAFDPRTEQSEDARYIVRSGINHLDQELEALSIWELTRFAWKCWWAVLLASIPIALGVLVLAVIIARLNSEAVYPPCTQSRRFSPTRWW
jgi:hypothetical protein